MNTFIRGAIGELDWSSVVWHVGQIDLALELAERRMLLARDGDRREREREASAASSLIDESAFSMPCCERLLRDGAGNVCDDAARAVDEERLGQRP